MIPAHTVRADAYFQAQCGISFDQLIAPIDADAPAGPSLRGAPIYNAIRHARQREDSNLPLGSWEHALGHTDWQRVADMAAQVLARHSKDLQVAAWLLQAQLQRTGLDALAPGLDLIDGLCQRYWDQLHPAVLHGDLDARANIFHWINEKLLPTVRMVPLTQGWRDGDFSWADWERAQRNDQIKEQLKAHAEEREGPDTAEYGAALRGTSSDCLLARQARLDDALASLQALGATLDRHLAGDAPSLAKLAALLRQMQALLAAELLARGAMQK